MIMAYDMGWTEKELLEHNSDSYVKIMVGISKVKNKPPKKHGR